MTLMLIYWNTVAAIENGEIIDRISLTESQAIKIVKHSLACVCTLFIVEPYRKPISVKAEIR